ncbi:hypothetical protein LCGC14_1416920 [marine sediment metagenome]|uniref:Uncharacterized protein n=1 Tax=marine sediment metagenome TaxID=412755 RepID=A0A0F9KDU1_9ZZZZ
MLHARNDYNKRIQDSENIIPSAEPVFLLRGQDVFAPIVLDIYATLVDESSTPDDSIVMNTRKHAEAMLQWQLKNKRKSPDMYDEGSVY